MIETQNKTKSQTKTKLAIDVILFCAFLIAMDPRSSGIPVHEWLGTSLLAVLVIHLLLSWDWIVQITRRFIGRINNRSRLNYLLNWLLFIDGTIIMLSGFMISEAVLPSLGIQLPRSFAWRGLHELSTNLFLVLLGLHTAMHWRWVVEACKRHIFQPLGRRLLSHSRKDVVA